MPRCCAAESYAAEEQDALAELQRERDDSIAIAEAEHRARLLAAAAETKTDVRG